MTLFVQPKDQNSSMKGSLSFWRKLEHISAKQQVPLGEVRFDVSNGDTSFVIRDQMSWSQEETAPDTNGFVPNVTKTAATTKSFNTIEEEDPYEKIEINRSERPAEPTKETKKSGIDNAVKDQKDKPETLKVDAEKEIKTNAEVGNNLENSDIQIEKPEASIVVDQKEIKNEAQMGSYSEKSSSEEKVKKHSKVETEIKILDSKADVCQMSAVENNKQSEVDDKITPMKEEGLTEEYINDGEISSKTEEDNKNSVLDVKDESLRNVSSESADEKKITKEGEKEKQVNRGRKFFGFFERTKKKKEKQSITTSTDCEIIDESQNNSEDQNEMKIQESPIKESIKPAKDIIQDNKIKGDTKSELEDSQKNKKEKLKKKEKKKTKEFKDHELEQLRNEFAKKQGVKGNISSATSPVKEDIPLTTEITQDDPVGGQKPLTVQSSKAEESLYEPVGEERVEFVMNRLTQANMREASPGLSNSDDNIIGFDLNTKDTESIEDKDEPIVTEETSEKVQDAEPPKLPSRRKNSKLSVSNTKLSTEEKMIQKEKKSSFIKEWQKDLKDFFTLRKKKSSHSAAEAPKIEVETKEEHLEIEYDDKKDQNSGIRNEEELEPDDGEAELKEEDSTPTQHVEKRKKKRRSRRKTNSESSVSNPFKLEDEDQQQEVCGPEAINQKPKVVVPSPAGIPRPLPLNKRVNGDSLLLEDEDIIREPSTVLNSRSVEDTEEFKKAVETFDEIFLTENGDQSPDANKRLSKKLETSPNVNWKRIKTSRSMEAEETIEFRSESSFQKTEEYSSFSQESTSLERQESSLEENHKKISILGNQYNSPTEDVLKNVDGPSINRKGTKTESFGEGARNANSENLPEKGEKQASDLTTRLEETNVRMRKISDMFDSYDGPNSEDDEESDPNNSLDPPQTEKNAVMYRAFVTHTSEEIIDGDL